MFFLFLKNLSFLSNIHCRRQTRERERERIERTTLEFELYFPSPSFESHACLRIENSYFRVLGLSPFYYTSEFSVKSTFHSRSHLFNLVIFCLLLFVLVLTDV